MAADPVLHTPSIVRISVSEAKLPKTRTPDDEKKSFRAPVQSLCIESSELNNLASRQELSSKVVKTRVFKLVQNTS